MKTLTMVIALLISSISVSGQNLISNWSFEIGTMQLVCNDWYNRCGDELTISCDSTIHCLVGFTWDSPSLIPEEVWSLKLSPGWPEEGFAETYVTGQTGTKVYELKYWFKTPVAVTGNYIIGYGSIGTGSQSQFLQGKTVSDTALYWKQITIIDTLTTVAADTITVRLSAENCDLCVGSVYFDFIELNVIANLTSIADPVLNNNENIKLYPNPASNNITIEIINNKSEQHRLFIYSQAGEFINSHPFNHNTLIFESNNLASGIYYYQVQQMTNKKIIGQGKFLIE